MEILLLVKINLHMSTWPHIHQYVQPRWWQGPVSPPCCVPVLPMGAPGCCSGSVVRCSCSCLPACRAPYRAVFRGLCGWFVCVTVLSLAVRMVQAARLVPWCRGVPSGVAGWARRNTSVPAGRGRCGPVWRARGPLHAPGRVSEDRNTGQCCSPPPRFLTLLAFCGEFVPCTILAGYMCQIPPSVPGV